MNHRYIPSAFLLLLVLLANTMLRAQDIHVLNRRIDSAIAVQRTYFSRGEYLYTRSESFRRLLWLRALHDEGLTSSQYNDLVRAEKRLPEPTSLDTIPAEDISNDVLDQDETSVAISRRDPRLIVVGANDDGMFDRSMPAYVSTDAGKSWTTYRLPKWTLTPYQPGGDPMVTVDANGRFYYAFLIYDQSEYLSNLMVASTVDGVNWQYQTPVLPMSVHHGFEDKEALAVDRDTASPHFGRLYMTWMHYGDSVTNSEGLRIVHSDDHGATWSSPVLLTNIEGQFSQPLVGKGGIVVVTYSLIVDQSVHCIAVSHDGGLTFSTDTIDAFTDFPFGSDGYEHLKGQNGFRSFPYMAAALDERSNRLQVLYGNYDPVIHLARMYARMTTNLGKTWSPRFEIGGVDGDCFHPALSLDNTTGHAYAAYYTSESDPNNLLTHVVRTELFDNAESAPDQLDNGQFNPLLCQDDQGKPFIGDYSGSDAFGGTYVMTWTQGSAATDGEVFATVRSVQSGVETHSVAHTVASLSAPLKNPVASGDAAVFKLTAPVGTATLEVFDIRGSRIWQTQIRCTGVEQSYSLSTSTLVTGPYFLVLRASGELHSSAFLVNR